MKFNPLIKRELTAGARSFRLPALIMTVNTLLFGTGLLGLFGRLESFRLEQSLEYRTVLWVYALTAGLLFLILLFLLPSFTSGAVTAERDSGTLDLLFSAGLSPAGILSGKLLARLPESLVLLASCLPALTLPLLFGGVTVQSAAILLLCLLPLFPELLSIGIFASSFAKSSSAASGTAYGLTLLFLAVPVLLPLLLRAFAAEGQNMAALLLVLCPAVPAASLVLTQIGQEELLLSWLQLLKAPQPEAFRKALPAAGLCFQLLLAALFFAAAVSGLNRQRGRR